MLSFRAQDSLRTDGDTRQYTGELLGAPFRASLAPRSGSEGTILTIRAPALSEEAAYMAVTILTGFICGKMDRGIGEISWRDTAVRVEDGWQVATTCSPRPEAGTS
mgnify:FL=1